MNDDLDIFNSQPLQQRCKREDVDHYKTQLKNAQDTNNKIQEKKAYRALGAAFWDSGEYEFAIEYFGKFQSVVRKKGDEKKSEGNASWNLGLAYQSLKQYEAAIRCYKEALTIAKETRQKKIEEKINKKLGNTYLLAGKYKKALQFFQLSLGVLKRKGDMCLQDEVKVCSGLGTAYQMLGKYEEAIKSHSESQHIASKLRDKDAEALAYKNLGKAYLSLENYQEALNKYRNCLNIRKSLRDSKEESDTLVCLGNIYHLIGKYKEARGCHENALETARNLTERDDKLEGRAYFGLGDANYSLGNYDEAIENYGNSLEIARRLGDQNDEGHAYHKLGDVYQSLCQCDVAISHYIQSLIFAEKMEDKKSEGDVHGKLGEVYRSQENYEKAIEHSGKYLKAAKELKDRKAEGKANAALGAAYHAIKEYNKAKKCYEECLRIGYQSGDNKSQDDANNNLGTVFRSCGQYREAITYHEKSLEMASKAKDLMGKARAYLCLGANNQSLSKYKEATQFYGKALVVCTKIGDKENEKKANEKLGILCQLTGKYRDAIKHFKKALKANDPNDQEKERQLNENLGVTYQSLHKYDRAIKCHSKSLSIAKEMLDKNSEVWANGNLGKTYLSSGNYLEALKYFEENLRIVKQMDSTPEVNGEVHANLGKVYHLLGEYKTASCHYKNYLEIAKEMGDVKMQYNAHDKLGQVYQSLGKFDDSVSHFEKGLKMAPKVSDKRLKGTSYGNLGKCYYCFGKYEMAISCHKKQLEISFAMRDKILEADAYVSCGNAYLALNNVPSAKECLLKFKNLNEGFKDNEMKEMVQNYTIVGVAYRKVALFCKEHPEIEVNYHEYMVLSVRFLEKSLHLSENQINHLKDRYQFKISIVDTFIETYKQLTLSYIHTKKVKEALLVSDNGRARALNDLLITRYGLARQADINRYLHPGFHSIAKLLKKSKFSLLFYALTQDSLITISLLPNQEEPTCCLQKDSFGKTDAESQIEKGINEIVNQAHDEMGIKRAICEDSLFHERKTETLKNSGVNDNSKGSGTWMNPAENTTDLVVTTQPVRKVKKKSAKSAKLSISALKMLHERLVAPAKSQILQRDLEEVVILPDGPLNRVPFAALMDQSGTYLSETKRIRLLPSLTTLKILQDCPKDYHCMTGALVIGNPKTGEIKYRGRAGSFTDLKYATEEAKSISGLLGVSALVEDEATKDVIMQKFQEKVAVIHIAAHGNNEGEIVLAPSVSAKEKGTPEEKDYILTMKEVQDIDIRAQLVVLSCCSTGDGEIRSEGVLGMSRAFLAAGARAVVAPLWSTCEYPSLLFMEKLYSYLKNGESASASLQKAMKDLRSKEDYREPKYWAPYFLMGDDVTIRMNN